MTPEDTYAYLLKDFGATMKEVSEDTNRKGEVDNFMTESRETVVCFDNYARQRSADLACTGRPKSVDALLMIDTGEFYLSAYAL